MSADEFDIIKRLFAPLATAPGARALIDDIAVLGDLVLTTDAIVEGVHFLADDPIDTVAKKALRVNVSDLTAKGARPVGALLTLIWPAGRPAAQIAEFARGLGEDLRLYDVPLLGGDTTSTPGPLTVSITMFGASFGTRVPSRAEAKPGEHLWVTGTIGDAFLGLRLLRAAASISDAAPADRTDAHATFVRAAYRTPSPPVRFAETVSRFAAASMDVSDGLIADAAKLAAASEVALRIAADAVPLSAAGHAYASTSGVADLITGGDDYQVLFTASPQARAEIMAAARAAETNVALIGEVIPGSGVRVIDAAGGELTFAAAGHSHKLGR